MAADANVFAQFLRPVKTVDEYAAESDAREGNKLQLAVQRIGLQEGQRKMQEATDTRNALQRIYGANPGADRRTLGKALQADPLTAKQGFDLEAAADKADAEKASTRASNATAGKTEYETQVAKADKAVTDIAGFQSPEQALQSLQAHAQAGDIDPAKAQMLQQQIQQSSQQPGGFAQWQVGMLRNILSAKDRLTLDQQRAIADQSNATSIANNAATNATSRANNQATVGATIRGQNLTDARAGATLAETGRHNRVSEASAGDKPLNDSQAKALLFGSRMQAADEILTRLAASGTARPGAIKQTAEGVAGAVPILGGSLASAAGAATNWTQSPDQQSVEQAQRDFVNAVLRRESGAAISPGEFESAAKQYFPAVGDSPQVLKQKAANRALATRGLLAEVPDSRRGSLGAAQPQAAKPGGVINFADLK